jgi:hypothetical protein
VAGLFVVGTTLTCGGSSPSGPDRGSQCAELMQDFCMRAANVCQLIPTSQIQPCIVSGINSCCGTIGCGAPVISTQAEIDACIADVDAASCASLDVTNGGMLPASCVGVVRSSVPGTTPLDKAMSTSERAGALMSR